MNVSYHTVMKARGGPANAFQDEPLDTAASKSKPKTRSKKKQECERIHHPQTGMLLEIPRSARCVQRFDDSLNSAIHITYRISLRSSSMREPRDPLLKVV